VSPGEGVTSAAASDALARVRELLAFVGSALDAGVPAASPALSAALGDIQRLLPEAHQAASARGEDAGALSAAALDAAGSSALARGDAAGALTAFLSSLRIGAADEGDVKRARRLLQVGAALAALGRHAESRDCCEASAAAALRDAAAAAGGGEGAPSGAPSEAPSIAPVAFFNSGAASEHMGDLAAAGRAYARAAGLAPVGSPVGGAAAQAAAQVDAALWHAAARPEAPERVITGGAGDARAERARARALAAVTARIADAAPLAQRSLGTAGLTGRARPAYPRMLAQNAAVLGVGVDRATREAARRDATRKALELREAERRGAAAAAGDEASPWPLRTKVVRPLSAHTLWEMGSALSRARRPGFRAPAPVVAPPPHAAAAPARRLRSPLASKEPQQQASARSPPARAALPAAIDDRAWKDPHLDAITTRGSPTFPASQTPLFSSVYSMYTQPLQSSGGRSADAHSTQLGGEPLQTDIRPSTANASDILERCKERLREAFTAIETVVKTCPQPDSGQSPAASAEAARRFANSAASPSASAARLNALDFLERRSGSALGQRRDS
jgi:hypothetical protein